MKRPISGPLSLIMICAMLLGCSPGPVSTQVQTPAAAVQSSNDFSASFRIRNAEIRADMIATLKQRNIEFRINDDDSIAYREVDGEAFDSAYSYVVGLYAARN